MHNDPSSEANELLIVHDPGNGSSVSLYGIYELTKAYGNGGGYWESSHLTKALPAEVHVDTQGEVVSNSSANRFTN